MTHRIYVDGQHGTTGLEIHDLLARRDDVELIAIDAEDRRNEARRTECLNEADIVVLCLPDDAARDACARIRSEDVRVIDASTAHRTDADWAYGLAELHPGQEAAIASASRVSNPGCYPTGFLLLVRPLIDAGLLAPAAQTTVHAVSGYSGGGRPLIERYELAAQAGQPMLGPRAYSLALEHKHVPEMRTHAGLVTPPLFAPSVGPYYRGMLVHVPLAVRSLRGRPGTDALLALLAERYADTPCVRVRPLDEMLDGGYLSPEGVNHTNLVELTVSGNATHVMLIARLDNLGKGAGGAAVQNLNLMLGCDPFRGLALHS